MFTFDVMSDPDHVRTVGRTHLLLIDIASDPEPLVLQRTFHLGVDENAEMRDVATTVDDLETIEGPITDWIHVHPVVWPLVLQDCRPTVRAV